MSEPEIGGRAPIAIEVEADEDVRPGKLLKHAHVATGEQISHPARPPAAQSVQINLRSEEVGREAPDHLLGSGSLFGLRQLQR